MAGPEAEAEQGQRQRQGQATADCPQTLILLANVKRAAIHKCSAAPPTPSPPLLRKVGVAVTVARRRRCQRTNKQAAAA